MHSKNYNNNTNQSINIHVTMPVVTVTSLRNGSVVHSSQVVVNPQAQTKPVGCYSAHSPSLFIITTQSGSCHSFFRSQRGSESTWALQ